MRVAALLATAFVVRAYLVIQGGQYYWPDERLYRFSQAAAECLLRGDVICARAALDQPEHVLFIAIGTVPGLIEQMLGANSRIPGLFFVLFSVASLWFLWRIAMALDGSRSIAFLALVLLTASSAWTYLSRHLLPYDTAMSLALASICVSVSGAAGWKRAAVAGLLGAASLLTYYGAWAIAIFALAIAMVYRVRNRHDLMTRAIATFAGALAPFLWLIALSRVPPDQLLSRYVGFAGTVTQGSFREGWSLPLEYFWHTEHGFALLWGMCVVLAIPHMLISRERSLLPLAGVLCIYTMLVLSSVMLEQFVVYGRTARQLIPFLCLVSAQQVSRFATGWSSSAIAVVTAVVVLQAAINLQKPLTQVFPDRFKAESLAQSGGISPQRLRFIYADHIYPRPAPAPYSGDVLAAAEHPLQFLPYQYEGFTPEERRALRNTDIRMRLVAE